MVIRDFAETLWYGIACIMGFAVVLAYAFGAYMIFYWVPKVLKDYKKALDKLKGGAKNDTDGEANNEESSDVH